MQPIKYLVAQQYQALGFSQFTSYLLAQLNDSNYNILAKHQEELVHPSASMIKVLILDCLVSSTEDLQEEIHFDLSQAVAGGGALQEFTSSGKFTLATLARLMITLSDNTATNLLIDFLSMAKINDHAKKLGLNHTRLQRKMMDFDAARQGKENLMTVQDYAALLYGIYQKRNQGNYKFAWETLSRQQFRDCLPGFWPEEEIFHHKTGELDYLVHDGGIFFAGGKPYLLICFSSQGENNFATKYKMAQWGHGIYKLLKENNEKRNDESEI